MNRFRRHRDVVALAAALVLPLGMAAILVPFRSSFANTASALVLVAVIVAVAVTGNRFTGLVATVSATLWFDLFLTRPYGRLAISHRPDIETAVSLFVVGVIVTELAARNRHHYEAAAEESDYIALIYGLSELVASGAPANKVVERARGELIDLLNLRDCRYEPRLSERRVGAPRPRRERYPRGDGVGRPQHGPAQSRGRPARPGSGPGPGPVRAQADPGLPGLAPPPSGSGGDRRPSRRRPPTAVAFSVRRPYVPRRATLSDVARRPGHFLVVRAGGPGQRTSCHRARRP